MIETTANSNAFSKPLSDPTRCAHSYPSGRRCRMPVSGLRTGLCANHSRKLFARQEADLSSSLVGELKKFETFDDINDVLSRLLILTSQDRVSPRRAAVIAYICNLLLRSVPRPNDEPQIIVDIPGPERESPEPAGPHAPASASSHGGTAF